MKKRYLGLLLVILLLPGSAWPWGVLGIGVGVPAAGCTASGTLLSCQTKDDAAQWGIAADEGVPNNTSYQEVKNGVAITICQIDMRADTAGGGSNPVYHLEIWEFDKSAQIGGDSDAVTIDAGLSDYTVVWSANKPAPTGDFLIVAYKDSGDKDPRWKVDDDNLVSCYEDTDYDAWAGGADRDEDFVFTVYTE